MFRTRAESANVEGEKCTYTLPHSCRGHEAPGIKFKGGEPNGGLPELVNFAQVRSGTAGRNQINSKLAGCSVGRCQEGGLRGAETATSGSDTASGVSVHSNGQSTAKAGTDNSGADSLFISTRAQCDAQTDALAASWS